MSKKQVRVACTGATTVPLDLLEMFQGELKSLSTADYKKLRQEILDTGMAFPVKVWQLPGGGLHEGKHWIVGGHQTVRVLRKMREEGVQVPDVPVTWTEAETYAMAKRRVLQDASQYGRIDDQGLYQYLAESGLPPELLKDSMRLPDLDTDKFLEAHFGDGTGDGGGGQDTSTPGALAARFVVPPFSVLDTRQGYWQERKAEWLKRTGNLSASKELVLTGGKESLVSEINDGSSNFDPVLAELILRWFNVPNGRVLDPFGGEQTKGVVAGSLGYAYKAVEYRLDQVDLNKRATEQYGSSVQYVCGDSNNIAKIITEREFDLVFTSPPYYDLEVYSKEDMSALGTYEEFMRQYENIFRQCVDMLAANRFLVVKVGEIRDKKTGAYRNFVGDNISVFRRLGLHYYNELVLISPAGTAPMRANKSMAQRKMVKLHQNVLVFYKGDLKQIKSTYPQLELELPEEAGSDAAPE